MEEGWHSTYHAQNFEIVAHSLHPPSRLQKFSKNGLMTKSLGWKNLITKICKKYAQKHIAGPLDTILTIRRWRFRTKSKIKAFHTSKTILMFTMLRSMCGQSKEPSNFTSVEGSVSGARLSLLYLLLTSPHFCCSPGWGFRFCRELLPRPFHRPSTYWHTLGLAS